MVARASVLGHIGAAALVGLCLAATASAQLIQPFSQDRRVYGQAWITVGQETNDTGLIMDQPAPDYFGIWTGNVSGSASLPESGSASFSSSYTGGWDGAGTISIGVGYSNGSVGAGGPPGCTMYGVQGQVFQMTFAVTHDARYTLKYQMGGAALAPQGILFSLQKVGDPEPMQQGYVAAPGGFVEQPVVMGALPVGDYEIYMDASSEVTVEGPGGNGGGNAISFTLQVDVPGDLNCDGLVDGTDIAAFTLALTDSATYALTYPGCPISAADCNNDTFVDVQDIGSFITLLIGS